MFGWPGHEKVCAPWVPWRFNWLHLVLQVQPVGGKLYHQQVEAFLLTTCSGMFQTFAFQIRCYFFLIWRWSVHWFLYSIFIVDFFKSNFNFLNFRFQILKQFHVKIQIGTVSKFGFRFSVLEIAPSPNPISTRNNSFRWFWNSKKKKKKKLFMLFIC